MDLLSSNFVPNNFGQRAKLKIFFNKLNIKLELYYFCTSRWLRLYWSDICWRVYCKISNKVAGWTF